MALQVHDVGFLVSEHGGYIAYQAAAVECMQGQVDRIGCRIGFSPASLQSALGVALMEAKEVAAVLPMNTDAAPLGDVTNDRFRWHGTAAACEVAHQVTDTRNGDRIRFRVPAS